MKQEELCNESTLVFKRTYNTTPQRLFKVWTDASLMSQWFRPNERWLKVEVESDPVPGGQQLIVMTHQDGDVYRTRGRYLEVSEPEKVVFTWIWEESPDGPEESKITVTFLPVSGGTQMTLVHENLTSEQAKQGTEAGWTGCLESLDKFLEKSELQGGVI